MARKHVVCCIGTRPEAIKVAPLVAALRRSDRIRTTVLATAQHRGMLDEHLAYFDIRADLDLDLMVEGQLLSDLHGKLVSRVAHGLRQLAPDLVVAHGDTSTVFCAGLACFYEQIPFGHLEGGLRTGDINLPFPEEMNRCLVARLADLHFAPTEHTRDNLLHEGVDEGAIHLTGNTGIDALLATVERAPAPPPGIDPERRLVLVTAHRRETLGPPLENILHALRTLARDRQDLQILMPVHANPRVREPVERILAGKERILLTPPLSYPEMVGALQRCHLVLTDSGGLQEEGPALGKPVLILRDETERPEGIREGVACLVGRVKERIMDAVNCLLDNDADYRVMARPTFPYGDGKAADRIVEIIERYESERRR